MPENTKRDRSKEENVKGLSLPCKPFDLFTLTQQEETIIQAVLQKDDLEMKILDAKISQVRKEIEDIRRTGPLIDEDDQKSSCTRCNFKFPPFFLPWVDCGERCTACKSRVCSKCSVKQSNGSSLCILCLKQRQEKLLTGEWMSTRKWGGLHGSALLKVMLKEKRRVPKESDEPKVGSYTQRPARSKDVDSESRTSKNSQSSAEQTDLKAEEKIPSVENIPDEKLLEIDRETEDKTRSSDIRQRRESYSRAQESQKTSLIPVKGNKGGGKPHWWKKDSHHHRGEVKSSKHGSQFDPETSSFGSNVSDTQHRSRDTNKRISSKDTTSVTWGSLDNLNANSQHVRKGKGSQAAIPSRFQFRRSSSLSQRDKDQTENLVEPSQQIDDVKTNNKMITVPPKQGDNFSHNTEAPADESNDKNGKAKRMLHKIKKPFKKISAGNVKKTPLDEETSSQKALFGSNDDTAVQKSKVSRFVEFMTGSQGVSPKEMDKNSSSITSKEQQKAAEKGKDFHIFRQQSVSVCEDVRENESGQLSGRKSCDETGTKRDFKIRAAGSGVILEKLLLPSQIKRSQNPFEGKQYNSKMTQGNATQLGTSSEPLRKCISLSAEAFEHLVLQKPFSYVHEQLTPDELRKEDIDPSTKSLKHAEEFDNLENREQSKDVPAQSEGDASPIKFPDVSDVPKEEVNEHFVRSWKLVKKSSWLDIQGQSSGVFASSEIEADLKRFKGSSDGSKEEVAEQPWTQVQQSSLLENLDQSKTVSSSSEKELNLTRFEELKHNTMEQQESAAGKLQENVQLKSIWSGSDVSDTLSIVTEIPEPGGDCEDFNFDLDPDSDDTFQDTRFEDSFSDDNETRSGVDNLAISGKPSGEVDCSFGNTDKIYRGSETWCPTKDLNFERRDSGIKFDRVFEFGDGGGSKTSQLSPNQYEAISEDDITRSSSSSRCDISDLQLENPLCSSADPRNGAECRTVFSLSGNQPKMLNTGTSLVRSELEENETDGSDDSPKNDDLKDDNVNEEESHKIDEECPISLLIASAGKNKTDEKPTLLSLAKTSPTWQVGSSSQSINSSHMPDVTVDLGAVGQRCGQTSGRGKSDVCNYVTDDESMKDTDSGITSGNTTRTTTPEQRSNQAIVSQQNQQAIPAIAVTNTGGLSFEEGDDGLDELYFNRLPNQLLGSRSSLADSRESIYSVYSDAGEVNYGRIPVTGEIMFHICYNHTISSLEVHVKQCRDLAPVDTKHSRSDPYVKTYLLPDKSRASKRKTRIKKHTLNPVFDEVLKYQINSSELDARSLWLTVWHNDRMGRNDFLGEVTVPLDYYRLDQSSPMWYPLLERAVSQEPVMFYKGDLFLALKYVPADMVEAAPKKKSSSFRRKNKEKEAPVPVLGEVHVLVREAQNLTAMRGAAGSNPFCKGYILPDVSHASKQKTPVIKKTTNPQWQHILVFEGVDESQLHDNGLELTIWDHEKLSSNDFLGGVRLNLGQGVFQGQPADCMDARGEEIVAWQSMMDHVNEWIDVELPLRASMGKQTVKN